MRDFLALMGWALLAAALSGCAATVGKIPNQSLLSMPAGTPTATSTAGPQPTATIDGRAPQATPSPTATVEASRPQAKASPMATMAKPDPNPTRPSSEARVKPGIEVLAEDQPELVAGKRVGLITNPTGVASDLRTDFELLSSIPGTRVVALFAGEHGLRGAEEAGKKLEGSIDPYTGVPVYSLYGSTLGPRSEWLEGIDVLVFDIQNSGSALYTYKFTMSFAMEAAAKAGIPFVVLDRPNPAGGHLVEGPLLPARDIWRHPLPVRHGMTNGELALMWNEEYEIGARLTVVKMRGWKRDMTWEETGLPWVAPSPNIPTADTALAYAGQALVETVANVSEGRGITKPFLITGAPWVDAVKAAADLNARKLPGVRFRPAYFQPTKPGEKFYGQMSGGVEMYFTDRREYRAVLTTLSILDAYRKSALRDIVASPNTRGLDIAATYSVERRVDAYQKDIEDFLKVRQKYLLYAEWR